MNTSTSLSNHEMLILAVAVLHAQGYLNRQGAQILRDNGYPCGEPHFANLLEEARERKWVITFVNKELFPEQILNKARIMGSEHRTLESQLKTLSGQRLRHLRIYYSGQEGTDPERWTDRLEHFSSQASIRVLELLKNAEVVGVGWGHTITTCVSALERFPNGIVRQAKDHNILFVPTCGDPLGPEGRPERASSALVARLTALWGRGSKPLSLAGVAVVIPEQFKGTERDAVRRYITGISDYKTIFGPRTEAGPAPLMEQVDCLITSVGSLSQDWQTFQSELFQVGGIPREKLKKLALGDIDGVLIPERGLCPSQREEFRSITGSWTGITLEQCERIASKAVKSGKPGIIVLAIGANKAEILLEIVKRGLANELNIDHDLAQALEEKL